MGPVEDRTGAVPRQDPLVLENTFENDSRREVKECIMPHVLLGVLVVALLGGMGCGPSESVVKIGFVAPL